MASTLGFEPGPHWWEASALTTAPSLTPQTNITNVMNDPLYSGVLFRFKYVRIRHSNLILLVF